MAKKATAKKSVSAADLVSAIESLGTIAAALKGAPVATPKKKTSKKTAKKVAKKARKVVVETAPLSAEEKAKETAELVAQKEALRAEMETLRAAYQRGIKEPGDGEYRQRRRAVRAINKRLTRLGYFAAQRAAAEAEAQAS
jgi:hypothetical protein